MTEKPKSYLAEMSTKVVKYLSKIHRKYRKVKVQSLPFIIEFDVKEKVSDLIIEFQLATNPAELFPGWKLESQEEEMIDYAFKMRGFSLRSSYIFSRPLCCIHCLILRSLWFMEFRR